MKKKLLLSLIVIVLGVIAFGAVSVSAETSGYYTYTVTNGEATITRCDSSISGNITIPSTLGGYPVTSIGYEAFEDCINLTGVTIPDDVTTIGSFSFYGCRNLTNVTIPNSVTIIKDYAFAVCTNLINITIPDSVTSIGRDTFTNTGYYNNPENWENDVLYINNHLIIAKTSISGIYTIKENTVTISNHAFRDCVNLTNITIPGSVTNIEYYTFDGCINLASVTIPTGATSIGKWEFANCTNLTSMTIPNSVTSIDRLIFYQCESLTSVTIPDSVTSIGSLYFGYCESLTSVTIPDDAVCNEVEFDSCFNITSITIPYGVANIGDFAFLECRSLTSITIPDSVTNISDYAFLGCGSLTNVYYNGTEDDWNNITIGSYNTELTDATRHYFWYVTLMDKDGAKISKNMQDINTLVDTSGITVPDGYTMVLYKDSELTEIYDASAPVTENLTLYVDFTLEGTKTTISEDKKSFTITPIDIENGKTVILALYNGDKFLEMQSAVYDGEAISFTTTMNYTDVKVMVWESFEKLKPLCKAEIVQ